MTLNSGSTLGTYEIIELLGAGGMGEVYRARDRKLQRDVAIKVLPTAFAQDPERLSRFKREAQLLAALNHPNIAVIHDIQEDRGAQFLVLELLQGESLAGRLKRGPMPTDEALETCEQVAEALEAAHEKGVLHRDLKPGNIQIAPDGRVKVLDFGLAKMMQTESSAVLSNSPTLTVPHTEAGMILGTAAYMSPEQARGRHTDKRTDIFAFGCVLYETLTGEQAFKGETVTDIIASVMKSDPDWSRLPADTPAGARSLLRQCLQKQPKNRLHEFADVRVAIQDAMKDEPATSQVIKTVPVSRPLWQQALMLATVLVIGAAVGWFLSRPSSSNPSLARLQLSSEPADQFGNREYTTSVRPSRTAMAISADGRLVVFSGSIAADPTKPQLTQLYSRRLEDAAATPISGTDGGRGPFFSPDGQWIGFWAPGKIMKVPTAGGPAVAICDLPPSGALGLFGASWGEDGNIYFTYSISPDAGITRVAASGGTPVVVTKRDTAKGEAHVLPQVLPGGKAILFTIDTDAWEKAQVVVQKLDTGERRVLIDGGADARYVDTGHLVYLKMGTLMAVPFDLQKMQIAGDSVALIENVMQAINEPNSGGETGAGQYAISRSGTLLYATGGIHPNAETNLVWVDRAGNAQSTDFSKRSGYFSPKLSPDQTRVAAALAGVTARSMDVWIMDALRNSGQRLISSGSNWPFVWSPDGKRIVYRSSESGAGNMYVRNADGSGMAQQLTTSQFGQAPSSWSMSGNLLAFVEGRPGGRSQIWVGSMDDKEFKARPFLDDPRSSFTHPDFSPDGHWILYSSDESGMGAIWVRPYPGPGSPYRISPERGNSAVWTSGGREIIYRTPSNPGEQFYSVAIKSFNPFQADPPRLLFESKRVPREYGDTTPVRGWDVSSDGKRILLSRFEESKDKPVTHINVVLNWTDELHRRVPRR